MDKYIYIYTWFSDRLETQVLKIKQQKDFKKNQGNYMYNLEEGEIFST